MARSPDRDDKRIILRLAEQGVSARKISKITLWSRPTISKVLQQEGFDPERKVFPGSSGAGEHQEEAFDFKEEMRKVDEETRAWWRTLTPEQQDRIIAMGPPEDASSRGFLGADY